MKRSLLGVIVPGQARNATARKVVEGARSEKPRGRPKVLDGDVQTIHMHIETSLCAQIDELVKAGASASRADFLRDAAREKLAKFKQPETGNYEPAASGKLKRWTVLPPKKHPKGNS